MIVVVVRSHCLGPTDVYRHLAACFPVTCELIAIGIAGPGGSVVVEHMTAVYIEVEGVSLGRAFVERPRTSIVGCRRSLVGCSTVVVAAVPKVNVAYIGVKLS